MENRLKYWLALSRLRGLERFVLKGVLERFGGPEGVFRERKEALEAFSTEFAKAVAEFDGWRWAEKEIGLIGKHGVRVITFEDPDYPPLLKEIWGPPCLLYVKGRLYDHGLPAVAVVGTRRPSHYGLMMAEALGRDLAASGVVVVSGMARGCDMAAHKGALSAKGMTVAVLGTGVDVVYPRENKELYDEICERGLVVSEYSLSTPPVAQNFPRRNRIISGLARGVLVVEAPLRSGSLMTARLALDSGREVFAVPGQATSLKSNGTNKLIKDGAFLVESAQDVLDALSISCTLPEEDKKDRPGLGDEERLVWKALGGEPVHIDSIMEKTGLTAIRTSALLLEMELNGLIEQRPGKCFVRKG